MKSRNCCKEGYMRARSAVVCGGSESPDNCINGTLSGYSSISTLWDFGSWTLRDSMKFFSVCVCVTLGINQFSLKQ